MSRKRVSLPLKVEELSRDRGTFIFTVRPEHVPDAWEPPPASGRDPISVPEIIYTVSITKSGPKATVVSHPDYPEGGIKIPTSHTLIFSNSLTGMRELNAGKAFGTAVFSGVLKAMELYLRRIPVDAVSFTTAQPFLSPAYHIISKTVQAGLGKVQQKFVYANMNQVARNISAWMAVPRDQREGGGNSYTIINKEWMEKYKARYEKMVAQQRESKNYSEERGTMKTLQEAKFASGSSMKIVQKMLNVLGRRIGDKFTLSKAPKTYKTSEGEFAGYMSYFAGGRKALRINFLLGKSDEVISVDYYAAPAKTPDVNLELNGLNIVQTIDDIEMLIKGEDFREETLSEARRNTEVIISFLNSGDVLNNLQRGVYSGWAEVMDEYKEYCRTQREDPAHRTTVMRNIQKYFKDNNLRLDITAATRRQPPAEQPTVTHPQDQAVFQQEVIENEHLIKYDMLDTILRQIGTGHPMVNGLILYGQAGIGKSYTVEKKFDSLGLNKDRDYFFYTGSIAGKTGLLQLLWRHANGGILVLDDMDGILTNKDAQNFLKGALNTKPETRWISYIKSESEEPGYNLISENHLQIELSEEEYELMEHYRLTEEPNDFMVDFTSDDGVEYADGALNNAGAPPEKFLFQSKIVIISNLMDFPSALKSRCKQIKIDMTIEQTLEYIRTVMDNLCSEYEEITGEMKVTVMDFLVEKAGSLRQIDFRKFESALATYAGFLEEGNDPSNDVWKTWVLIELMQD